MNIWRRVIVAAATGLLLAACGDNDRNFEVRPAVEMKALSSAPGQVSGGDVRIGITAPAADQARLELWLNGSRIDPALQAQGDRLEGIVDGLNDGENTLEVRHADYGLMDTLTLNNHPISGPMFSGPQQQPFVCTSVREYGKQPKVESATAPGFPVYDDGGAKIGYSRNCEIDSFVTYWYRSTANGWKLLPEGDARPADMATTTTLDGETVDFVVRQERGTINRFLYSYAMLAAQGESPDDPDTSLWNGRLLYYFQGGVGIGHSQGQYHSRAMDADILGKGYAIVYSSGTSTGKHYNLQVGGETALMTKEGFVKRYGVPTYTVGLGGSGGAIQQYIYAQNHPGLLDAALPVQSYPDMVTQTIHIGDCELLEYYMDATDRANTKWQTTKNRSWLQGLNGEDGVPDPLAPYKPMLGYATAPGSNECLPAWRGLTPLAMNPHFGNAPEQDKMEPAGIMDSVQWTHYDDLRNIYGVDANGNPRPTWDNVGVQYGLKSLKDGHITAAEFLDVNFKVGGWKHPNDMVQEGFPFFGTSQSEIDKVFADPSYFDPWSSRNMRRSADPDNVPAPRTSGDLIAMKAAYTSGMVFSGNMPIPTIDHRQYMERELDMHNTHQSFAVRKRVVQKMGDSDHLVIWFTDTMPGVTKASQSLEALEVMDEWMSNIRRYPERSLAENRPGRAVDSCFDLTGRKIYAGENAWNGILDDHAPGVCASKFPIYGTSRIVAGAPIEGGIYKCALKPVDTALTDGTYSPWAPTPDEILKLKTIFPDGVCDYSKPDQARPA